MITDDDLIADASSEGEVQFLIAKYLQNGPLREVGDLLVQKLQLQKTLPKRVDWLGNEHFVDYEELNATYSHLDPDYLLKVVKNVGRTQDEGSRSNNVDGITSLLQSAGCSRLDVLRSTEDCRKVRWQTKQLLYSRNPWIPRRPSSACSLTTVLPGWTQLITARQIHGSLSSDVIYSRTFYGGFQLHKRILGHLAAAFNVLFDRSGKFLLTGSDDRLLKLWNVADGRLLFTFRGHSAEVVIMAINDENTMLASVATDRNIRIWDLQTGAQLVVHKHASGFISSLKFSPSVRGQFRYLIASAMDGSIMIWKYDKVTLKFSPGEVIISEKVGDLQQTKICSISFTTGGTFLASGCSEGFVRVYNLLADGGPAKMLQKRLHADRVDSVEYCHVGDRLLTGSRDGTGRIWLYRRQEWTTILLNSAQSLSVPGSERHDPRSYKRRVTMVGWSRNDHYALLASDDNIMRVFDSFDGRLVFELAGHTDSVYVLESHPFDTNIYMTAGHDARLILWSLIDGSVICRFEQWITGHGPSPFVDAKWSPDGNSIAATDMFGTVNIYGRGPGTAYSKTPDEQFFHTDYRPLMRDEAGFVVDEQTMLSPNLMQPPFLVSAAGVPYPAALQRMVPGRTDLDDQTPAEPLPALDAALQALNNQAQIPVPEAQPVPIQGNAVGIQYEHPPDPYARIYVPRPLDPLIANSLYRRHKELAILEIERYKEQKTMAREAGVKPKETELLMIPPPRIMASEGEPSNAPAEPNAVGMQPPPQFPGFFEQDDSDDEDFHVEEAVAAGTSESETEVSEADISVASVEARARQNENGVLDNHRVRRSSRKRKRMNSESEKENSLMEEELENLAIDGPSTSRGPTRARPPQKRPAPGSPRKSPKKVLPRKKSRRTTKSNGSVKLKEDEMVGPQLSFPSWLTETVPKPTPYFPQVGDILYYYMDGHTKYVEELQRLKICSHACRNVPYALSRKLDLEPKELVKIVSVEFEMRPPNFIRMAKIIAERIGGNAPDKKTMCKIYFHETDIEDFLVLKQFVDRASAIQWEPGQRVRSLFSEEGLLKWYKGTVDWIDNELQDSVGCYHMVKMRWDTNQNADDESETERLSPWDLYLLPEDEVEPEDGIIVTEEELISIAYAPEPGDWVDDGDAEEEIGRIRHLFEMVDGLKEAELFLAPVDLEKYPGYSELVRYPIDLNTIKQRLKTGFYRRKAALLFDIDHIVKASEAFNESLSDITLNAHIVADVCSEIVRDVTIENSIKFTVSKFKKKWKDIFDQKKKSKDSDPSGVNGTAVDASLLSESEVEAAADDDHDSEYCLNPGDDEATDEEIEAEVVAVPEEHLESDSEEEDDEDEGYYYGRESRPQRKRMRPRRLHHSDSTDRPNRISRRHTSVAYREGSDISNESESFNMRSRRKASQSAHRQARMAKNRASASGPLGSTSGTHNGADCGPEKRSSRTTSGRIKRRSQRTEKEGSLIRSKRSTRKAANYAESDMEAAVDSPADSVGSSTMSSEAFRVSRSGRCVRRPDRLGD